MPGDYHCKYYGNRALGQLHFAMTEGRPTAGIIYILTHIYTHHAHSPFLNTVFVHKYISEVKLPTVK